MPLSQIITDADISIHALHEESDSVWLRQDGFV